MLLVVANWDEHGGLQRRTRALASALREQTRVTVVTWRGASGPSPPPAPGVAEVRVPSLVSWARDQRPAVARANTAVSVATALAAAVGRREDFHAVYAASPSPEGLVAAGLHRLLARAYVVDTWLPGPLGNVERLERSVVAGLVKRALGGASAYLAATEEVAGELTAAGFDARRVAVIREGVDLRALAPNAERRRGARARLGLTNERHLLCLARFDLRQKRHDLLVEAWRAARPERWRLVLAGDGPDRAAVERMAHGIEPPPLFPGWQEPEPWLLAADANALPTNFETTGLSLVEGMAAGLAGIASATRAYRALAPDGVLLVPNEADAWASAIRRLTSDAALRERLGRAGRAHAERAFDAYGSRARVAALLGVPLGAQDDRL